MKPKKPLETAQVESQKIDIKSRLGYYSEFVTAYELAVIIDKNKGKLSSRSKINVLKKAMNERKKELTRLLPKNKLKDVSSILLILYDLLYPLFTNIISE